MKTIIRTDYSPADGPQLDLVTNTTLVWQLRQIAHLLPMTHAAAIALMQIAAERIETMHADYVSNGPMADGERRLS